MTVNEICRAIGGKCDKDGEVNGFCTDTRKITDGCLYIALKGERFDGHDFIEQAVQNGAAAVVSEKEVECSAPVIIVEDTRKALLDIANYYRSKLAVEVVGITGSVGKTSTKDMVYTVLSHSKKTVKTAGNLNNEIGMPLTIFGIDKSVEAAVLEMGMQNFGEISVLSKCAAPDCAIVTNIGYCHIEFLKTRENIRKAKLEIIDGMKENAPLILNADDDMLSEIEEDLGHDIIYYGIDTHRDVWASDIVTGSGFEEFTIHYWDKEIRAKIPINGRHNIMNALAAFCVGRVFNIPAEKIAEAFLDYKTDPMRQSIEKRGNQTVITDCYNASPTSMKASISVLGAMEGRRIAVLGDMLELGEMSAQLHEGIADCLFDSKINFAFLFGSEMKHCAEKAEQLGVKFFYSPDKAKITEEIKGFMLLNDVILFKGSRGMKLEEIIEKIWQK